MRCMRGFEGEKTMNGHHGTTLIQLPESLGMAPFSFPAKILGSFQPPLEEHQK